MNAQKAILTAMEEVLGLNQEEMAQKLDLDLFNNELLDSLTLVTVINQIERLLGKKIEIKKMNPADFHTVNNLVEAIERQIIR